MHKMNVWWSRISVFDGWSDDIIQVRNNQIVNSEHKIDFEREELVNSSRDNSQVQNCFASAIMVTWKPLSLWWLRLLLAAANSQVCILALYRPCTMKVEQYSAVQQFIFYVSHPYYQIAMMTHVTWVLKLLSWMTKVTWLLNILSCFDIIISLECPLYVHHVGIIYALAQWYAQFR